MKLFFKALLHLLFPPYCVSCNLEGDFLCKKCVQSFVKKKIHSFRYSGKKPKEFNYLDGVIYALDYAKNPAIQAAIEQFKYRFTQELAGYFGTLLAEKLDELFMIRNQTLHLIPIPLHPKRMNYRGFNQAQVIAEAIQAKMPHFSIQITPLLERIRDTNQQAKLNRRERQKNLQDAFKLNKKFVQSAPKKNTLYFLVDDVCTTGATLENAAKTMKEQGFPKVHGLVVARAFK